MAIDIPFGQPVSVLSDDPGDSAERAAQAQAALETGDIEPAACRERLNAIVSEYPASLSAWAALGELALADDVISAYAFFRVGYHRGLDRARASGWNGTQQLRWQDEPNRPFLRCLNGLRQAAEAIGETAEVTRIGYFLRELDPDHPFDS